MAEALYRKYRPQIFEDVVGQEHIERTIKNAIGQDKVSHAYLFTGPRGTGKTTTARLLAKALLCEKGPTAEPDGTCGDCLAIAKGEHPDVYELDAASRTGVENVREEIIGRVQFAPTRGRYKVYIIDEVHMLSTAAFNALLKTLEEPPSHVVFILCTTDPQKVPETIHSRCQRFDFRRISAEAIVSRLGAICVSEGVEFEGEALDLVAHRAEGGMRNALTSLEQLIAFGEGKVTMEVAERLLGSLDSSDLAEIVRAVGTRDVATCFRWTAEYVETGADLAQFTRDLAEHVRNMYVLALAGNDVALEVSESTRHELAEELAYFGVDRLARLLGVLGDLSAELRTSTNPRLSFEIALTRMVRPDSDLTLESLAERVEALESGYSAVAHVVSAPAQMAQPQADAASVAAAGVSMPMPASVAGVSPAPEMAVASATIAGPASVTASQAALAGAASGGECADAPVLAQAAADAQAVAPVGNARECGEPQRAPQGSPAGGAGGTDGGHSLANASAPAGRGVRSPQLLTSLGNPAALQRLWQAALTALKKSKAAYGVLFLNTKAVYDAVRSVLVVEFSAESTFAFKAVQKPEIQDALAAALRQACGEDLPFLFAQAGGSVAAMSTPASPAATGFGDAVVPAAAGFGDAAAPAAFAPSAVPNSTRDVAPANSAPGSAFPASSTAASSSAAPQVSSSPSEPQQHVEAPAADAASYDVYDDMPPYDDEPVPYGATALADELPPARPAVLQSETQSESCSPASPEASVGNLEAILETGFGTPISVEDVSG